MDSGSYNFSNSLEPAHKVRCRVISLWQPWAFLVVIGAKKIETRGWDTKARGQILIHASQRFRQDQFDLCRRWPFSEYIENIKQLERGAIIGAVDLWNTETSEACLSNMRLSESEGTQEEYRFGDYSPGRYCWHLRDAIEFAKPIPCSGRQGFWFHEIDHPLVKEVSHA